LEEVGVTLFGRKIVASCRRASQSQDAEGIRRRILANGIKSRRRDLGVGMKGMGAACVIVIVCP